MSRLEAGETVFIFGQLVGQGLDRHVAIQPLITGKVHDPHPPATDLACDRVVTQLRRSDAHEASFYSTGPSHPTRSYEA